MFTPLYGFWFFLANSPRGNGVSTSPPLPPFYLTMNIKHNAADQEFTSGPADDQAELAYSLPTPGVIDFVHTFVPEDRRGQGEADQLARAGLAYARQHHLKARTSCEFMAAFAEQHQDEYQDVLEG
ncbi:N-acetyltransferase [Hymenobacter sp. HMF4947]|uniref:N-acetyltransferase n=1 Tax=Hymenobacter ginkgonis TaxID=2682976 RepID=A0A7K1T922_9BACT|nr:GNAT family N-acetyltransferase [Hymenobacter ginkgonis]MVN74893.1 N-acetyltransferase [Hymenobacter ginkgonis]